MKRKIRKLIQIFVCCAGFYFSWTTTSQATDITNNITSQETWTVANSPYVIKNNIAITSTGELTIDPGVVVQFDDGVGLNVDGVLLAVGTAVDKITFTSSSPTPTMGIWEQILFSQNSSSQVSHVIIEYAKYGIYQQFITFEVSHSMFRYNLYGVLITLNTSGVPANIHDNHFNSNAVNIGLFGIDANPPLATINNNYLYSPLSANIYTAATDGTSDLSSLVIDATDNWWGRNDNAEIAALIVDVDETPTSPDVDFSNPKLLGNALSGDLNILLTASVSPIIITNSSGTTAGNQLIIDEGVELKFLNNGLGEEPLSLINGGTLQFNGTAANPITVTSITLENPTQHNPGDWGTIQFLPSSSGNLLTHTTVEYGTKGLWLRGQSFGIDYATITNNLEEGIILTEGSSPAIINSIITNNSLGGIVSSGSSSQPSLPTTMNNNVIEDNIYSSAGNLPADVVLNASDDMSAFSLNATHNWWGTTVLADIQEAIYDNQDAAHLPVVDFIPYLDGPQGNPISEGPTNVSGTISADITWYAVSSPYIVTDDIIINSGATLTIQPGTEIRFDGNHRIVVNSSLVAQGTAANRITFTSNQPTPAIGDWQHISLNTGSSSTLDYVTIEFADRGLNMTGSNITPTIRNSVFQNNNQGIHVSAIFGGGANPLIENNTIQNNTAEGLYIDKNALGLIQGNIITGNNAGIRLIAQGTRINNSQTPQTQAATINNNAIHGNTSYNLAVATPVYHFDVDNYNEENPDLVIDATLNWWGTTDLDQINQGISDQTHSVSTYYLPIVDYSQYLDGPQGNPININIIVGGTIDANQTWVTGQAYAILENTIILSGVTLTIQPDVEVQFAANTHLRVDGTLDAQGTLGNEILFTSTQATPSPGAWDYIELSDSSIIRHAQVEYADRGLSDTNNNSSSDIQETLVENNIHGMYFDASSPVIQNIMAQNNTHGIYLFNGATAQITNSDIINNSYGIYVDLEQTLTTPTINNNTLANNTTYDVYTTGKPGLNSVSINFENNWWGTTDTTSIDTHIYDNNDAGASPVVDYTPFLYGPGGTPIVDGVSFTAQFINPHNSDSTTIQYTLNEDADVTVSVLDFETQTLVRTLLNAAPQLAGNRSVIWDGRDDSNAIVADGTYLFTVEAINSLGHMGGYSPAYSPHAVTINNPSVTPPIFNPYKGDMVNVAYDLTSPAFVTLQAGVGGQNTVHKILIDKQPRRITNTSEYWDGRDQNGTIESHSVDHDIYGWTEILPDNAIVIEGGNSLTIDAVTTDPYAIYPRYGDATEITYTISEQADVTVEIKTPNPVTSVTIRTLQTSQPQSAGTYTLEWDGKDDSGRAVTTQGHYKVRITAVDASNNTIIREGNITVFP